MANKLNYGYELAYQLACDKLNQVDNIDDLCLRSGAQCQSTDLKKTITVCYLNRSYQVNVPGGQISAAGSKEEVLVRERILILHYLIQAKGTPPSRRLIAYKELPEGPVYFPTFAKRAIKPLVDNFGQNPALLKDVVADLGAYPADIADVSVTINAFPKVPITLALWQGDAEFPAEGSILFDTNITDYLTTEDINVLCEIIAWKLVKRLEK